MTTTRTHRPVLFFSLAFLITWPAWFAAAYCSTRPELEGLQFMFIPLGMFAPFIAVLLSLAGSKNRELRRDFWERLKLKYIRPTYLIAILLIMPLTVLLATAVSLLFGRPASQFLLSPDFTTFGPEFALTALILIMAPTLEELGWRGYGIDSLRTRLDLPKTTLLFSVLWALWHLPLFFIHGYYQNEIVQMSPLFALNFVISLFPATFLMNWLYVKNNRSITAIILFHFMLNLFSMLFQTEQFTKCIVTAILILVCVAILALEKDWFFSKSPKAALA